MRALCLSLLASGLVAAPPAFTVKDALHAEWRRQAPAFTREQVAALPVADRARLEGTLARIGAPGAPRLLPPEWEQPTAEAWLAKAAVAKTPRERFDALFFLNRLKSPRALEALAGLTAKDAAIWPRHMHLEAALATARLNGAEVGPDLQAFLDARQKLGNVDPVRAQAARLRLVMAGKEKDLLPPVAATPGAVLALMDAWNRAPWEKRQETHFRLWVDGGWWRSHGHDEHGGGSGALTKKVNWSLIGLLQPSFSYRWGRVLSDGTHEMASILGQGLDRGMYQRWLEGSQGQLKDLAVLRAVSPKGMDSHEWSAFLSALAFLKDQSWVRSLPTIEKEVPPELRWQILYPLRKADQELADQVRSRLLSGPDPIARAAAIDDLAAEPADLEALLARLWKVEEYDGVQVLLNRLEAWKLPEERRKALLQRFYEHPCWTARLDAHTHLKKLDPAAPWPTAPEPTAEDRAQLALAERLAAKGHPVRLRLTFEGKRTVVLRLDPRNAPLNVANLVRLARKGFFDGRRVPRVVPDFVVQMGSPVDTMDGGPGYTVRCENSLDWYGPGSVGMALSGKDTGGSQFFITTNATPHLTGRYTRVGEVENPDQALPLLDHLELGAKILKVQVLQPGR